MSNLLRFTVDQVVEARRQKREEEITAEFISHLDDLTYFQAIMMDISWSDWSEEGLKRWEALHRRIDHARFIEEGGFTKERTEDIPAEVIDPKQLPPA